MSQFFLRNSWDSLWSPGAPGKNPRVQAPSDSYGNSRKFPGAPKLPDISQGIPGIPFGPRALPARIRGSGHPQILTGIAGNFQDRQNFPTFLMEFLGFALVPGRSRQKSEGLGTLRFLRE